MTSYREGHCRLCGEYSQGVHIDTPGLCTACAEKWGNPNSWNELQRRMMQAKVKKLSMRLNQPVGVCDNCGRPLFGNARCVCTYPVKSIVFEELRK